ncbi:spliceosome-associated protein CWC27 homolog [Corticium candelabrum]|uniref:spliceosome-associated protein CWC27 homolog n=1 Tax=Corticium candelabrum TaxID=121492 RepID=UPI002E2587BA|nr:spliceosome-associated protein CWC27 homolog [Corticium candelabrum]
MSNIYIQEPPTNGKILLYTTCGEIEVELWSKETPKTCRNFVQLCLEGYYDGTIFHRIVAGFIIQGGDPTGTGEGGESIYGPSFRDEFHQRLRFVRRGLVGMASNGPNTNGSQFFFTLDRADELNKRHTLFGKVAGNTVFNMLRLAEKEIGPGDRPLDPPKIIKTEVLSNPFDDIVPREIRHSKVETQEKPEKHSKSKATKNFSLLSFGDEAEEDEEQVNNIATKIKSSHDVLTNDPKLSSKPAVDDSELENEAKQRLDFPNIGERKRRNHLDDDEDDYDKLELERKAKREALQRESRELKRQLREAKQRKEEEKTSQPETVEEVGPLADFRRERDKYLSEKKAFSKGSNRQEETLAMLSAFQARLSSVRSSRPTTTGDHENEDDSDVGWMTHTLVATTKTPVSAKDANIENEDTYDIYDPRNPINKRRRQKDKTK